MRRGQPRRWAIYPYTDRELTAVALRVQGIKPEEIASRMMISRHAVDCLISAVYRKAGIEASELQDWARIMAFDAPLPAERPEDMPEPKKRRTKTRIRMRR